MADIAERADASRGTAFNHFPTKGAFTLEWAHRRQHEAAAVANGPRAGDVGTVARIRIYFAHLASVNERERRITVNMLLGWLRAEGPVHDQPRLSHALVPWIETAQEHGEIDPAIHPEVAANLLQDGYLGVLYRWIRHGDQPAGQLEHEISVAVDLVLNALTRT